MLSLILVLKQQLTDKKILQMSIANINDNFERISLKPCYCLFNSTEYINLNSLSINKKHIKNTNIIAYEIKCITKQNIAYQYIDNKPPLCFNFTSVDAYIIEENKDK